MEWIDVYKQVPDNRRNVHIWGILKIEDFYKENPKGKYFGISKFNPSKDGGNWDRHIGDFFDFSKITHWAEIEEIKGPFEK